MYSILTPPQVGLLATQPAPYDTETTHVNRHVVFYVTYAGRLNLTINRGLPDAPRLVYPGYQEKQVQLDRMDRSHR